jgi:hypothetical protein
MSNKTKYPNSRTIVSRFKNYILNVEDKHSITIYENKTNDAFQKYYMLTGFLESAYFCITIIKYAGKNQKLLTRIDFTTSNKEKIKEVLEELIPNIKIQYGYN